MSGATPTGKGQGDPTMEGFKGSPPAGSKHITSTPQHKACSTSSPVPYPSHRKHLTPQASRSPKPFTPYAGVTYMIEYLRKERLSSPLPLDPHLFPEGLLPGDVVDVEGKTNCGKSVLILTLIASALLPTVWCGIELGGCSTGVTFIDCDQHFSIFQLFNLMYKRVKTRLKQAKNVLSTYKQNKSTGKSLIHSIKDVTELLQSSKSSLKTKIEEMVHNCLKSLYYIKCMESEQFPIVLAAMEEHLAKHSDVSLVVVESLSAFCWYDWRLRGANKFHRIREYYDRVLSVLLSNAKKYKVVLLTVKHKLFKSWKPRRNQIKEEIEKPLQNQRVDGQHGENKDMVGGDEMKTMAVKEYLGYGWGSSVTWRIILSKPRVRIKTPSCVTPKCASTKDSLHTIDMRCEHKNVVFSAEILNAKQRKLLFFVIDEEGVVWR